MLVALSLSFTAQAHEALEEPMSRYQSDGFSANKACPCGLGPNDTLCSGSTTSDSNRSVDRINEYAAGETITVRLHEVVGHSGRWRIAFDPEGADQADFNANILLDEPDPAGAAGNTGKGDLWEFEVTLPDTPCDNCTLQVIQVMNGNTVDPVPDPTGHSTYYQCADLLLTGGTDTGADTAADTGATDTGGDTGATGTEPTPTSPTTPTTPGGDSGDTGDTGEGDDKACSCATGPGPAGLGWALLGLAWLGRSRRR